MEEFHWCHMLQKELQELMMMMMIERSISSIATDLTLTGTSFGIDIIFFKGDPQFVFVPSCVLDYFEEQDIRNPLKRAKLPLCLTN
jgi:hypothetical protein